MSTWHDDPLPAIAEEPTPEPSSAVTHMRGELQADPFVRYMIDPPAEDVANLDAMVEAGDLYGDDQEQALADLRSGRHPLQRARAA